MALSDYLEAQANSHAKEELFNSRLLYDLKLAAAVDGYHLQTYYSDVDHDGFDIIFDDRSYVRKVQLKTVARSSSTQNWQIHRGILRPTAGYCEELGFNLHDPLGVEGGVILMDYEAKADSIEVEYLFTDIFIISAIALGLLKSGAATVTAAETLRKTLQEGGATDKIGVARGLFVKADSPQNLLALIGLKSDKSENWQFRVSVAASEKWGPKGRFLPARVTQYTNEIVPSLETACGHSNP